MKKISLLIITLLVETCLMAATFDTIRMQKDWSKLVNRVSCEYTKAYIQSLNDEAAALFVKEAVPQMENNGQYISTDKLCDLLVKYDWSATASKLVKPIADRKAIDGPRQTLENLTDISCFSATMQGYLADAQKDLVNAISEEYQKKEKTAQPQSAPDQEPPKVVAMDEQRSVGGNYDLAIFILALVAVVEALVIVRQTSRKRIVQVVKESNMMHRTYVRKDDDDIADLHVNMARLQKRLDRIDPEGAPKSAPAEGEAAESETNPLPEVDEGPVTFRHL